MKRVIPFVAALVILAASTPAFAQQDNKPAIVVMSNGLGAMIPVNDQVAIRPEFSFAKTSTEFTGGVSTTTKFDSWALGGAVSALVYMGKPDTFRAYWSPRFAVNHQNSNSAGSNSYNVAGSFGAQYGLGNRFKVFGELGLNYGWANIDTTVTSTLGSSTSTSKNHAFGTRSAVGVAFNF